MNKSYYFLFFVLIAHVHLYGAASDTTTSSCSYITDEEAAVHTLVTALSSTRPSGTILTQQAFYSAMDTYKWSDFVSLLRTCNQPIRIEEDVYAYDYLFRPPLITASEEKLSLVSHALYMGDYESALSFAHVFPEDNTATDSYRRGPLHYLCSEVNTEYPAHNKNTVHQLLTLFKDQLNDSDSDNVQSIYKVTNPKLLLTLHTMGATFDPKNIRRYGLHTKWNTRRAIAALHCMGITTETLIGIFRCSRDFIQRAVTLHGPSLHMHMQEVGHYLLQSTFRTTGSSALTLCTREYYGRETTLRLKHMKHTQAITSNKRVDGREDHATELKRQRRS